MTESWTLDVFIIGSVVLILVPLIACFMAKGKE